jgi:lipopolysaccharide export system permease protein
MKILDRYIMRQFAIHFVILLFVLVGLFVLIDLMVDLDEFVKAARIRFEADPGGRRFGGMAWQLLVTIFDFHGPLVVLVYVFMSGLVVVAAVGFTFNGLTRSRELAAMVSSGISMYRLAAPAVVLGVALNALALPLQEYLIPRFAQKLTRSKSSLSRGDSGRYAIHYVRDGRGNLFSASQFDPLNSVLSGVMIRQLDTAGHYISRIWADEAVWDPARKGWSLVQGHATSLTEVGQILQPAAVASAEFVATDLSPQVLLARQAAIFPRLLGLADLRALAANPNIDSRQITQIMHGRFSLFVINVLVLIMSLSFFLLREPTNLMLQAVKAAAVCVGAFMSGVVVMEMGIEYVNPVTAAWLPVVFYLPLSALLLQTVKT